jgi:hypothetical protein
VAGVLVNGFNVAPNNQLGDGIDANDMPYLPYFPYVGPPQNPRNHEHHDIQRAPSHAEAASMGRAEALAGMGTTLRIMSQNPGSHAVLEYALPHSAKVSLRVYDPQGRMVRTLVDQDAAAGTFRASWDGLTDEGHSAARGVFFARLVVNGQTLDTKKVVVQ